MKTLKDAKNAAAGAAGQKTVARKGANGVLLKKFEAVMYDMFSTSSTNDICQDALHQLTPRYSKLPPFISNSDQQGLIENAKEYWNSRGLPSSSSASTSSPWPFDADTSLPQCGCVRGDTQSKVQKTKTGKDTGGVGDVHNKDRAWRKEMQLSNLIQCVLAMIPNDVLRTSSTGMDAICRKGTAKRPFRIVDFAGGTGHLAVPLALLLPQCEVVCVDLKKRSLDLLHQRVDGPFNIEKNAQEKYDDSHKLPCQSTTIQTSKTLPNLSSYHGSIQTYPDEFDIGVSLQ